MCLGTLISPYGNFLTTNHYLMTSSRPTFDPDLRNSCIRKCKKERSLLLQNWITAESSSQPHSHSSREKLHHSPLFRQNPLSNKSLKIPITSYDKVSANTASWFPQCYEKSDGSQESHKSFRLPSFTSLESTAKVCISRRSAILCIFVNKKTMTMAKSR